MVVCPQQLLRIAPLEALGGTIKESFRTIETLGGIYDREDYDLLSDMFDGIVDGFVDILKFADDIVEYGFGAVITGIDHIPGVTHIIPQPVADWGAEKLYGGNAAIGNALEGIGNFAQHPIKGTETIGKAISEMWDTYVEERGINGAQSYVVGRAIPEILLIVGTGGAAGAARTGIASGRVGEALRVAGNGIKLTAEGLEKFAKATRIGQMATELKIGLDISKELFLAETKIDKVIAKTGKVIDDIKTTAREGIEDISTKMRNGFNMEEGLAFAGAGGGTIRGGVDIAGETGRRGFVEAAEKNVSKAATESIEGVGSAEKKIGKFIDNTTDPMTKGEKQVVDDLVGQGKIVERIPKDPNNRTPDFKVDGVKTELKTLENPNTNTGMKRIQKGFNQGTETVIIDARNSGLTKVQAEEILARVKGKYPDGQLPGNVEIWIDGQVITYP